MSEHIADLPPGFFWIRMDGLPSEIARRDPEAGEWVLAGVESGVPDDHEAEVVVLDGPLPTPARRTAMRNPHRILSAAAAALLIAAPATAQTSYLRGPDGRNAGRIEQDATGAQRFYDSQGRNAGRAEPGGPGEMRLYDRDGRPAGTTERATPGATMPVPPPRRGGAPEGR